MISGGTAINRNLKIARNVCFLSLLALVILWVPRPVFAGQIVIDADGQFEFARSFMEKGDYGRAISEYERFVYFSPMTGGFLWPVNSSGCVILTTASSVMPEMFLLKPIGLIQTASWQKRPFF